MSITTSIQKIHPSEAEALLGRNTSNRNLRRKVVSRYADDMRDGNWLVTGAAIVISPEGRVLDGQHRLHACIEADVPFETVVVDGATDDVQVAMDSGLRRRLSDVLKFRGEQHCTALGSAIRAGWQWKNGIKPTSAACTNAQALEWLYHNPSIRDALKVANRLRMHLGAPVGVAAVVAHQTRLIDFFESEAFFNELLTGENLVTGQPTLTLRNWLISQMTAPGGRRPYVAVYHAVLVKTWNHWAEGSSLKAVRWRRGGKDPESFPPLLDLDGLPVEIRDEIDVVDEPSDAQRRPEAS